MERQMGSCAGCGMTLKRFCWDGDHKVRYTDGGKTEVENGQALCKTCHTAKTRDENRLTKIVPRGWQTNALEVVTVGIQKGKKKAHITATPGGGKTIFSAFVAQYFKRQKGRVFMVIAVPTISLKNDFTDDYGNLGYRLAYLDELDFDGGLPDNFDGVVVSYVQLEKLYAKLKGWLKHTSFLIFLGLDEIHHAKDSKNAKWGENVNLINTISDFSLTMSGTPFRSDGYPIALFEYDENGCVISDFTYTYKEAVADYVCRAVEFIAGDSKINYTILRDGQRIEKTLELSKIRIDTPEGLKEHSSALRVLSAKGNLEKWFLPQFRLAHAQLLQLRKEEKGKYGVGKKLLPTPGGLIICPPGYSGNPDDEKRYIEEMADEVERETGRRPVVILSDDDDAQNKLKAFKKGDDPWIIAIRMISEGINIPRLRIGVLGHSTISELLFYQIIGRLFRNLTDYNLGQPLQLASWYIPAFPHLLKWGKSIEEQAKAAIKEGEKKPRDPDDGTGGGGGGGKDPALFIAGNATHNLDHVIGEGKQESFKDPDVIRAGLMRRSVNSLANVSLIDITEALRASENIQPEEPAATNDNDFEGHDSLRDQYEYYRRELNSIVKKIAYAKDPGDPQFSWAWKRVYDAFFPKMPKLSMGIGLLNSLMANYKVEQFKEILEYLQELLLELQPRSK